MNKQTLALAEHYLYGTAGTAVGIVGVTLKTPGHHDYKSILWALAAGIVVPVIAKLNPNSLVNKISKNTGLPTAVVASAVSTGIADATKTIDANAPKA